MRPSPKNVLIISRTGGGEPAELSKEICIWLESQGVAARVAVHRQDGPDPICALPRPDLILVVGGDGTFISVARCAVPEKAPLLGLNFGRVGFLAEVRADEWRGPLSRILEEGFRVIPRMAMSLTVHREGKPLHESIAVNDLVVGRGAMARLVGMGLSVDGERVCSLRSDGIIVSTPPGSTAYCASAGGPVVHPDLMAFCLAPICPFLNTFRPLVVPGEATVEVEIEEARGETFLTEDGQNLTPLMTGDRVVIRRSEKDLLAVQGDGASYFHKLKSKGFITER